MSSISRFGLAFAIAHALCATLRDTVMLKMLLCIVVDVIGCMTSGLSDVMFWAPLQANFLVSYRADRPPFRAAAVGFVRAIFLRWAVFLSRT